MTQRTLLFLIFLAVSSTPAVAGEYNAVLDIGDPMPGFSKLPTVSGEALSSGDLKAAVIVLVSLANHCPWVRGMDPDLVALARDYADRDVRIIGFSVNHLDADRLPAMKQHARKQGYSFSYIFDESQDIGRRLGATRTPEYFVFDQQRKLIYMGLLYDSPAKVNSDGSIRHIAGEPKQHYVRDAIDAALAGRMPEITETRAHGCSVKYIN